MISIILNILMMVVAIGVALFFMVGVSLLLGPVHYPRKDYREDEEYTDMSLMGVVDGNLLAPYDPEIFS